MDKLDFYSKNTLCWFKDEEECYKTGTILSKQVTSSDLIIEYKIGNSTQVFKRSLKTLEANGFEDLPLLRNPPRLEGADDLTTLSYLHEAALLNSVKVRYSQETIYTYSGLVLIAMNPFRRLNIYTSEIMRQYAGRPRHELEPHLFAIAEEAYRKMILANQNQSIIVSGESGAGKTMSAKFVMRYFAIVDELGGRKGVEKSSSIEDAVLSTNPIMEAFGNAKTTRNDNSSRFGKYIEILFEPKPRDPNSVTITGARVRTYLLERSRLVFQAVSERNYHIFYQLCAAAPDAERKELGLDSWDKFFYLKQGKTGTANGMDDAEEFAITQQGLSMVGISVSQQWSIFRICAALLHIGNIKITESGSQSQISDDDPALILAAKLLHLDKSEFKKWLTKKQITTRSEKIISNASLSHALNARDAIAKFIYSKLFDWIVKIVNTKLDTSSKSNSRFIGVLDIYGFEHFPQNSFEQFCINFANEKLQAEFARHVFKLEQEEYMAEEIAWSFINFSDNQACIDMIEGKLGILDLLDEESRLPAGKDQSLVLKLYKKFGTEEFKYFEKPRFGEKEFVVKHYALDVAYQIDGFIEKNKDTVSDEQLEMLNNSDFGLFKEIIEIVEVVEEVKPGRRGGTKKPTLGSTFKMSLIELMETLRKTNPHYIRCIKPNQSKAPFEFEPQNVLGQLIACGVLETIKISRAGYPSKQTYAEFVNRYYFLLHSSKWRQDVKKLTEEIIKSCIKGENKYELGKTKVFFRAGQLAYLEKVRSERYTQIILLIQKNLLRNYFEKRYKIIKASTVKIQRVWRGYSETKEARTLLATLKAERAKLIADNLAKGIVIEAEVEEVYDVDEYSETEELESEELQKALEEAEKAKAQLAQEAERLEKAVQEQKDKDFNLQKELELQKSLKQMSLSAEETADLKKYIVNCNSAYDAVVKASKKLKGSKELQAKLRKRDAHISSLQKKLEASQKDVEFSQNELKMHQYESTRLKEQLKNAPAKDDQTVEALKQELASMRELMARMFQNKNKPEPSVEVTNRSFVKNQNRGSRMSSFFESAAHVTELAAQISTPILEYGAEKASPFVERAVRTLTNREKKQIGQKYSGTMDDSAGPKPRAVRMLEAHDLEEEVIESLIINLQVPMPSTQKLASVQEIFFPARLIGFLMGQMLEYHLVDRMREMLGQVVKAMDELSEKLEDDFLTAFWFSNANEFLNVLQTLRLQLKRPSLANQDDSHNASAVLNQEINIVKHIISRIHMNWIKEFKKRLSTMVVPAVIEHQSLPAYICNKNDGGLWGLGLGKPNVAFTISQLITFLDKISSTMKYYYVEETMYTQVLNELMRVIGISAFNHLIMRKNYCTWKRGIQIEYNVKRLEEWCIGHGVGDATLHLQSLAQAAKLLREPKTSAADLEQIYETCYLLNSTQIKKLLSCYYAVDFDSPMSSDLQEIVNNHTVDEMEEVLLNLDQNSQFVLPEFRSVEMEDGFIPEWIHLPYTNAVVSSTK